MGYWFLIASALSNCNKPCAKYVLAVYKSWQTNRGNVRTSVGNYEANDWYSLVTCIILDDLQHHSVAESGDYEESLIRQEYMVAGVDRQNENEIWLMSKWST